MHKIIRNVKKLTLISSFAFISSCAINDTETYLSVGSDGRAGHESDVASELDSNIDITGIDTSKDKNDSFNRSGNEGKKDKKGRRLPK